MGEEGRGSEPDELSWLRLQLGSPASNFRCRDSRCVPPGRLCWGLNQRFMYPRKWHVSTCTLRTCGVFKWTDQTAEEAGRVGDTQNSLLFPSFLPQNRLGASNL